MRKLLIGLYGISAIALADSGGISALHPDKEKLARYEASRILELSPTRNWNEFRASEGMTVTRRDAHGTAIEGKLRVLVDNPDTRIAILADFNQWGGTLQSTDWLRPVPGTPYHEGIVRELRHGMEYRLAVNGRPLLDPSASAQTSDRRLYLNSVFWDLDRPDAFRPRHHAVDSRAHAVILGEIEMRALAAEWSEDGQVGPRRREDTYRFIADSGLVDQWARMGYNAIEFLPFNTSVDGDAWHLRYQVFGLFGPDMRYGTPDDFRYLVDKFNEKGIAVIMDAVVGHFPVKGNAGLRALANVGLDGWKKANGQNLFGFVESPWGTLRYDYANPYVRRFLIDSLLTMLRDYHISGIRFDNLDGIRFYEHGGGDELIRETVKEIRQYQPEAYLIGEMFFPHPPVLARIDRGGFGINVRTHSNLFDFFKDYLQKSTPELNLWVLRDAVRGPWEWNEASRLLYLTNHDEAANRRDGATGAYVASLVQGGGWPYVEAKTKVYGTIPYFAGSAIMDMPQLRLLQEGTFNTHPAVEWSLLKLPSQAGINDYFTRLSQHIRNAPAFAFRNYHAGIENHVDNDHKVMSFLRKDFASGKRSYGVVNLSHAGWTDYVVGVEAPGTYRIVTDSDQTEFRGSGRLAKLVPSGVLRADGPATHGKAVSLKIPYLAPMSALLLAE